MFVAAWPAVLSLALMAAEAPITSATVYGDRARVVRTAQVRLAGEQTVEFPPLADRADLNSIRVQAEGAQVLRIELQPVVPEVVDAQAIARLRAELDANALRLRQANLERDALVEHLTAFGKLRPNPVPTGPMAASPRLDPGGWLMALQFSDGREQALQARLRQKDQELDALEAEALRLLEEERRAGGAQRRTGWKVLAHVSGHGAAKVHLHYVTTGATWRPRYELQLDPGRGEVTVSLYGQVLQQTGDDWRDVALTLSTAIPLAAVEFPKVATWKIGERERFIPTPAPIASKLQAAPAVPEPAAKQLAEVVRARQQTLAWLSVELPAPPSAPAQRNVSYETTLKEVRPGTARSGTAVISGTVVDASNEEPVADVVVTATAPTLMGEQVVLTDGAGVYRIPGLPSGTYALRYEKEGFKPFSRTDIALRQDVTVRVNTKLMPSELQESIEVVGTAPTIDVGSSSTGVNVSSDFVRMFGGAGGSMSGGGGSSYVPVQTVRYGGLTPPPRFTFVPPPDSPAARAGGYDLAFASLQRESVPTGQGAGVPLLTERWPVRLERRLFPALTPYAYLAAELKSPSQRVLPGGPANLFVGADPAGTAELAVVAPGEPFTLPLGVDRAVKAARNVQLVQAEKGVFLKDDVGEYVVTTEFANPYDRPIDVRVLDQLPLAGSDKVEVKLLGTEPWAERDEKTGRLEWRLTVPPASKTKVSFRYSIRRPKHWLLTQQQDPEVSR